MPRNAYQKGFIHSVEFAAAGDVEQFIPIIGSDEYTRFSIEVSFNGAGDATLLGSVSGSATDVEKSAIPIDDPSYTEIMGSDGEALMKDATSGIYTMKMATHLHGGLVLHLKNLDNTATVKVQMIGNVFGGPQVSRGL